MAKEKTSIQNAEEQIKADLYGDEPVYDGMDRLDRLRQKTQGLSERNTGQKDTNGMMNTMMAILGHQQRMNSLNIKANGTGPATKEDLKNFINSTLGLASDFGVGDTKRINRYNDYRIIDEYIPELSTSLDILRDSILSPDDFSKKNAFFIYDVGNEESRLSESDRTVFDNKIKELSDKFGLEQYIKDSARDALLLGDDFTIVRPIKEEFFNLLTESSGDGLVDLYEDTGSYITETIYQDKLMQDLLTYMDESFVIQKKPKGDSKEDSKKSLAESSEEELKKDPTAILGEVVKGVKDNLLVVRPEAMLSDSKKVYKDLKHLKGAYFKHVRPDDIVKLELDHVCIGYLYFDRSIDQDSANILGRSTTNTTLLQAMTAALNSDSSSNSDTVTQTSMGGMSFTNTDNGQLAVEGNTAKAYDALVRLFSRGVSEKINKRFLEDNEEFREVILSLLKNDYLITKKVAVTFLEPESVVHNKLESSETYGKSMYKNGLFFAKLYLINVLNTMMIKINQGRDKRVFYVENGLDDDFEGIIEGLVRDLKSKEIPTNALSNEHGITTVMRQVGSLESYYIPVNEGNRSFDIDVIPGMQVDVDDSELDRLLRSAQRSTGVPYNYIDASTDIDFSRTLAIQNQGFVKTIISHQGTFSEYYTKVLQKLWQYEFEEDEEKVKRAAKQLQGDPASGEERVYEEETVDLYSEYVKVLFPAPTALNASAISDQINTTEQLIEYLAGLYYEEDEESQKQRRVFKRNLAQTVYLTNVDWNIIETVKKKTDEDFNKQNIEAKLKPADDGSGNFM